MNRAKLSSEEIAKQKNFDSVLKQQGNIAGKAIYKKPWFLSSVVVATIAVVTSIVLMNKKDNPEISQTTEQTEVVLPSDSLALETFYKAEEAKSCIAPPVAGLNIPYTVFKVNAEKGGLFEFKTGTKLNVPKNAFVGMDGKLLKGEIELRYREFHDGVDIFLSGIPMTYDSAGNRYHFESAGMMEMLAYQDGKQVGMADGKSINIDLASNHAGDKYNLYKLDTLHNNWSCLGKDKVVSPKQADVAFNEALPKVEDSPEYKVVETKKVEVQKEKEVKIAALPKPVTVVEPKKPEIAKKGKFTFNLDVDPKEFPELNVYKGLLFEVGDENKNFNSAMYDVTWDDATVKEGAKKGQNYILTLKKGTKKHDLVVYPVFEGKNYEAAMKEYQDKFNKYNVTLEKRKEDEKKIEADYQTKLAALKAQQLEIERKWKEKVDNEFRTMDTQQKVRRVFAINSFGVYNCDNPMAYPKGVLTNATLTNEKDSRLMCYEVFLVDKKRNGMFTYSRNPVTSFSFDPKVENILWTVENGVIFYLKPEDFASVKNGTQNIKLSRIEQKFNNAEEMKKFFNL